MTSSIYNNLLLCCICTLFYSCNNEGSSIKHDLRVDIEAENNSLPEDESLLMWDTTYVKLFKFQDTTEIFDSVKTTMNLGSVNIHKIGQHQFQEEYESATMVKIECNKQIGLKYEECADTITDYLIYKYDLNLLHLDSLLIIDQDTFQNNPCVCESSSFHYVSYYHERPQIVVIGHNYWEAYNVTLFHNKTKSRINTWSPPVFCNDYSSFFTLSYAPDVEFMNTGIQVFKIVENRIDTVWELKCGMRSDWGPQYAYWKNDSTLNIRLGKLDRKTGKEYYDFITVEI